MRKEWTDNGFRPYTLEDTSPTRSKEFPGVLGYQEQLSHDFSQLNQEGREVTDFILRLRSDNPEHIPEEQKKYLAEEIAKMTIDIVRLLSLNIKTIDNLGFEFEGFVQQHVERKIRSYRSEEVQELKRDGSEGLLAVAKKIQQVYNGTKQENNR